ncbi:MAG: hypothetical protein LV480_03165 [Methylacidiphilales bacterium]|nr:hypothetical protein [Candidatus Methylacidiphilales bacterium]
MTALLKKALNRINALPPEEQDAVASLILEEIESEKRWDELFASSQGQLARLAEQAIAEYKAGKTKPLDPERDL